MSTTPEPSTAQRLVGDIAPKLAELTDQVLFGDVWARPELARRDRSLVTVAALVTNGSTEQLVSHLRLAKQNGLTETELVEAIIHLAFYAGWPRAMSAIMVAKRVFAARKPWRRRQARHRDRDASRWSTKTAGYQLGHSWCGSGDLTALRAAKRRSPRRTQQHQLVAHPRRSPASDWLVGASLRSARARSAEGESGWRGSGRAGSVAKRESPEKLVEHLQRPLTALIVLFPYRGADRDDEAVHPDQASDPN